MQTILSHNGSDLSGGQKQRLVLARGFVSGRSIFLVDEGTSALDQASAIKIEDTLIQDPNLTLLMVTHHLRDQTAAQLDQVFQLHEQLIS
ncbi:ATP-binding cassette domain-containing protein [Oenococcus sicerae]|uniref:ATP-binding cassette domain-containing protein n=1 Tax=Oenococcus sicerae TaxID=2203724 RepID=UPI001A9B21EA|nr:ATP-binding cassette domain-containing protein [Oenococcus sicerae]